MFYLFSLLTSYQSQACFVADGFFTYIDSGVGGGICYCECCQKLRNGAGMHQKGEAVPSGWCRFALRRPPGTPDPDSAADKWHVAFSGARLSDIRTILDHGQLLLLGKSPAVLFWLNSYCCHSVACTLLVQLYWEPTVRCNFCAGNMNIESQYFMDVWGWSCIMFQANWVWSAVQFGETNQKKMTRMDHSFCFHPALNMLPHHPSLASMSKYFVWQGSACHKKGCKWVLVCAYTLL